MVRQEGFSLIELLIVVAIILVISAIAVPSMVRSRIAANEAAAVASVRTVTTAETAYASVFPNLGYTCKLSDLGPPAAGEPVGPAGADVIDAVLATGKKTGYDLTLSNCGSGTPRPTYASSAVPFTPNSTGIRAFCSDASGVIWFSTDSTEETCRASGTVLR